MCLRATLKATERPAVGPWRFTFALPLHVRLTLVEQHAVPKDEAVAGAKVERRSKTYELMRRWFFERCPMVVASARLARAKRDDTRCKIVIFPKISAADPKPPIGTTRPALSEAGQRLPVIVLGKRAIDEDDGEPLRLADGAIPKV